MTITSTAWTFGKQSRPYQK